MASSAFLASETDVVIDADASRITMRARMSCASAFCMLVPFRFSVPNYADNGTGHAIAMQISNNGTVHSDDGTIQFWRHTAEQCWHRSKQRWNRKTCNSLFLQQVLHCTMYFFSKTH